MTRALVIAALLVAGSAGAVPRNTVKAHIDKATKAHAEGKFDVALEELEAAYALDPKPDLLFAIGQVYAKLDNCTQAISYYEKFSATTKDAQAKQVVTQAIDACKTKLAATAPKPEPVPEPVPEPEPPKVEVESKPTPVPVMKDKPAVFAQPRSTPTGGSPWYKDPIGDALVGGGIAAGVVALVMRSGAQSEADKAVAPGASENDYRDHSDKADSKETLALVFGVTAGALVTGGIIRYVTRSKKQETTRVGIAPATTGGVITVLGRF